MFDDDGLVLTGVSTGWQRYGWVEQLPSGRWVGIDIYCHWIGECRGVA